MFFKDAMHEIFNFPIPRLSMQSYDNRLSWENTAQGFIEQFASLLSILILTYSYLCLSQLIYCLFLHVQWY